MNTRNSFSCLWSFGYRQRLPVAGRAAAAACASRRAGFAPTALGCLARDGFTSRTFPTGAGTVLPTAGPYSPPPGAVLVAPGQPYVPTRHPVPMRVRWSCRRRVLVPAPPLPSYEWSAPVDALFLERSSGGSIPLGYTYYNSASGSPAALPPNSLYSDDVPFPLEAGLRLEISRKFDDNITLAATYWGLQQWSVGNTIYGDPYADTVLAYSPYLKLPTLLSGLDNSLGYTYASQIQNVEINALLRLNPSDPYWEVDWLCGARYVYFAENFTLTGVDDLNSATEQLNFKTTNNLIGCKPVCSSCTVGPASSGKPA